MAFVYCEAAAYSYIPGVVHTSTLSGITQSCLYRYIIVTMGKRPHTSGLVLQARPSTRQGKVWGGTYTTKMVLNPPVLVGY